MGKFLGSTGLTYLWGKIKAYFAPLASPTFTGTPSAPTAVGGTSTTQIATTAFVEGEIENAAYIGDDDGTGGIVDSETGQQVDISKYAQKTWVQGQGYLVASDISGKQDTLVSGTNIKTVNNQSLLGSGNITIEGGSGGGGGDTNVIETVKVNGVALVPDANKAVDVPTLIPEVSHGTSDTTFTLTPNVLHRWGTLTELTISLPTDSNSVLDEFMFEFTSGATPTAFNYPATLEWVKELVPEANKTYQVSIQNNLAGYITADMGFDVGDENVIEGIKVNGNAVLPDANKVVSLTVPTALSGLTEDTTHRVVTDTEKTTWTGKQDALVSGTNIKTINNQSLLGEGNISISGGSGEGGDENVIEVVKVNGTALTPDENKAVDVTVPTESTVSGWGFTKNSGTYSKPSGGIPATDLASAVQTSLGKADTALQSFTESDPVFVASAAHGISSSDITNWNSKTSNVGTITGITMNGSSKGTSGVVDLGTVLTSYTETDPTVPSWAKASSKPSYTASEVGAVPTSRTVNGKALSSNISLTASDVGAVDASGVVTIYSGSSTPSSSTGNNGDIYIKTS